LIPAWPVSRHHRLRPIWFGVEAAMMLLDVDRVDAQRLLSVSAAIAAPRYAH